MSTYEVGTVLWIIHTDRPGLVAYRVVEEITKRTMEGEQLGARTTVIFSIPNFLAPRLTESNTLLS